MNSSAHLWLAASSPGYCEKTDSRGDCTSGDKGAFGLAAEHKVTWPSAVRACLDICAGCPRCRHISVGPQFSDCSWFSTCKTLSTAGVRRALPAPADDRTDGGAGQSDCAWQRAGPAQPPLAIATVLMLANSSSSVRSSCGLVKYCSPPAAAEPRVPLSHLETVVLTNAPAAMFAALPRDAAPARAPPRWPARARDRDPPRRARPRGTGSADDDGRARTVAMAGLARWQLVALTEYTAILCVDLDVDLLRTRRRAAGGGRRGGGPRARVDRAPGALLNDTQIELVARADFHSPINLGVVWLKPSKATHDLACACSGGHLRP